MTKKKAFIEHSVKFALWLVKACIVVAALTGAIIAASIFVWQGTMFLVKEHGILWALPVLVCSGMILHLMWSECSQSKQEEAKVERSKAAPDKPEPRWRKGAPTSITDVPLEEWAIGALTILRQIELRFDSEQFCGDIACGPILHVVRPGQHTTCIFVDEANPVALHAFVRNGGTAFQQEATTGNPGKPTRVPLPFYLVIFPTAKTDDALADLARSIRSEAQAEIDRRARSEA
jgi:hypothetical protein